MKYYLAIDIGASSGRHIVGWMEGGELKTEELYRFPNGVKQEDGHLLWETELLLRHVRAGIDTALAKYPRIESLSIDTWGCDYVLLDGEKEIWPCYAYRDMRTEAVLSRALQRLPYSRLYERTGCQFQPFNTLFQLFADREAGRLKDATDFLMIPEYLMYKLTGVKAKEYTNATTTGLVNAKRGEFDRDSLEALGLPLRLFPVLQRPGTILGEYKGIRVVLCATHDTGSAVEGIPMEGNHPYISSGTWSLLGVKTERPITNAASMGANWSNEGGVGYNRYQKNIMGMWLVNRLRAELCPEKSWDEITAEAEASSFERTVDANDGRFLSPAGMKTAFDQALGLTNERPDPAHFEITNMPPELLAELRGRALGLSAGDYFRCACRSLALSYKTALDELERNTGRTYDKLYIVGGGAKNQFLNRLTEEFTGKQVIALPIEATAIGNLKIQIVGGGVLDAPQREGL